MANTKTTNKPTTKHFVDLSLENLAIIQDALVEYRTKIVSVERLLNATISFTPLSKDPFPTPRLLAHQLSFLINEVGIQIKNTQS